MPRLCFPVECMTPPPLSSTRYRPRLKLIERAFSSGLLLGSAIENIDLQHDRTHQPSIEAVNDLLTLADIATMHHCSVRHARDVIVKLPGFPAEAPTSTPRNRLWLRVEVRAYIHRRPVKAP